ncbi:MAG TPA: 30S ribosomal protein S4 [Dehalococcoidia bacterium]|nr:30S ribosomal protein S4 [Dehalococcoidia bacterium]
MARYTGPVCRLCRREGQKLFLKGEKCYTKCTIERRPSPPGQRPARRRKVSDRALQLREKQRAREVYGVLERQFRRYHEQAVHQKGVTGDNLVRLLEGRLDNVVYRLGWADSRNQARQIVRHGHITLNGRKTDVPSAQVRPGDTIGWSPRGQRSFFFDAAKQNAPGKSVVPWLSADAAAMTGRVLAEPDPAEAGLLFDPSIIVEYYSR